MEVKKSDYWTIECSQRLRVRVSFEDDVSEEEAILSFKNDNYHDITDIDYLQVEAIHDAEAH